MIMTLSPEHYLVLAAILFSLGLFGVYWGRKTIIAVLMSIELMLLAVNINLIAFSSMHRDMVGQLFVLFILTVAAAEAAIGLAILVIYHRQRHSVAVEDISAIRG